MDRAIAEKRLKIVRDHMEAENALDFDAAIGTFNHPRYELVATGQIFDGVEGVQDYSRRSRAAFPDQNNELISLRLAGDDAIISEFWLMGTNKRPPSAPMGKIPPTGKSFRVRMCAVFEFEDEKIVCERLYFDSMSLMRQLTGGDPQNYRHFDLRSFVQFTARFACAGAQSHRDRLQSTRKRR